MTSPAALSRSECVTRRTRGRGAYVSSAIDSIHEFAHRLSTIERRNLIALSARSGTQPRSRLGKRVSRRPAGSWTFPLLTTRLRVRPAASGALVFGDIDRTLRPERIAAARLPQVSDGSETATGSANDQPQAQ